jgi:enoyl-CoA hydratase/carnithine racemase
VRSIREAVVRGLALPLTEGLLVEAELMGRTRATADAAEGIAAFVAKRAPVWPGY